SGSNRSGIAPAPAPDKAAPAAQHRPTVAAPAVAPAVDPAGSWREFVASIGKERKFLASHLDTAKPLELPPGRLRIGVSERHHLAFLLDGDNLATLKEQAKKFFGQEVNVQIVNLISEGVTDSRETSSSPDPARERSPIVTEALR